MTSIDELVCKPTRPRRQGELLLELLSEEIPARMQRRAIEDLTALLRDKLAAAEIAAAEIRGYATPRRLVVIAEGIPPTQPDRNEERRGPRVGAPQAAIDGFLRSAGLGSIEECEIRDTGRGEFYFAIIRRSGRPSAEVLAELVKAAITELPWPKSMRWPGASLRWVRPLTAILCLYGGEILPLAIEGVPVGRTTRGHRFLSPGEFCAGNAAEYLEKLEAAYVILDHTRRKRRIESDLVARASIEGLTFKPDPALLDEVTGLVEFPVVLAGKIYPEFMTLPHEVLATAMRTHQKYFSCINADGRPASFFLFVANNLGDRDTITAGNERVLRARLADAGFFWDQDRKIRLEDRVDALKDRVYHAKLGTMYDKTERMEKLAVFLAEQLYPAVTPAPTLPSPASGGGLGRGRAGVQSAPVARTVGTPSELAAPGSRFRGNDDGELSRLAQRAARLAKADLSSSMVGEFPELQGTMGRYYALHDNEAKSVANAIADHYKPQGPNDVCPTALVSVVLALADKIDALVGFFAIGEKPTGSRDPFALRRAALGIIRLILENQLRLSLTELFSQAHWLWVREQPQSSPALDENPIATRQTEIRKQMALLLATNATPQELLAFFVDRLKVHLREQGFRHDLIAAAFAPNGLIEDDLVRLVERVKALQLLLDTVHGSDLLTAYRRASSIVAIEERRDNAKYDGVVELSLLREPAEMPLALQLEGVSEQIGAILAEESFTAAMVLLGSLRGQVDDFFEKVTVNCGDKDLRRNRLHLLSRLRDTMNRVADFSQIEG